ncbi:MAG: HAD family phosphatase [Geodermatophilaceae bacterium]|nr:HAD family phosphatase [Geodermatophilaceae bacterium]
MSTRPRLVATDLDGTLLGSDGTVSPRTAQAVARVEAAGVPVVIVTGRPPRWLAAVAEQLDHRGIAVCANGAVIWDMRTGRIVESDPLDPSVLAEVTSRLRAELGEASFAVEYGESFTHEAAYPVRWARANPQVSVGELADLLDQPAVKLLVRHPSYGPDQLLAAAQALLGDSVTMTHSSYDGLLEISAAGVTKATGLARVAASHDIEPEEVLAFGDMPNDLPMFAWAGRSVAVANAHQAVLDVADDVTGSNAEDGVAAYLEPLFP